MTSVAGNRFKPETTGTKARQYTEWAIIIVVALMCAFGIRQFVLQTFYIPSKSMVPTLEVDDRVIVNKLAYRFGEPHRGDIVVFKKPTEPPVPTEDLIKRVVAVAGDTIESREGAVYVNGARLSEPYLVAGTPTDMLPPTSIPPDRFFVMGDNRTDSFDARFFGPVEEDRLIGKAEVRLWPASRAGAL